MYHVFEIELRKKGMTTNNKYSNEVKKGVEDYVIDRLVKSQTKRSDQFIADMESFINSVYFDIAHQEEGYDRGLISPETADELSQELRREVKFMQEMIRRFKTKETTE